MIKPNLNYTKFDVVNMIISLDGQSAIAILKARDNLFLLRSYSLAAEGNWHNLNIMIEGTHIKAKQIDQCKLGKNFNMPYIDNGQYWVIIFDLKKERERINISEVLGLP